MAQLTKVLALQGGSGFALGAHMQMLGGLWRMVCICNPRIREVGTGGPVGFQD